MPDPRQKLYKALSNEFDLGSFEEFNSKMNSPESRQKLYSSVSNKFDLGSFEEFESKVSSVKKKEDSVSTSQKENGDLAPKNGSLGTDESNGMATLKKGYNLNIPSSQTKYTEKKPVKTLQLKNKLLNTKVTPENVDEINAATNELSALQKKQTPNAIAIKRQEDLQKDPNFLSKYQDFMSKTSTVTDDDVLRAKEELNSEIDNSEWTDVLREGAKKAVNNVVDFANTPMKLINSLGGDVPTIPLMETKKPLEKNLKQADEYFLQLKKDAIKNNKSVPKVTQEERLEKAKDFFIKEKTDSYLASRQKDYLQEQDDIDGGVLQSKFADFEKGKLASIDEKEKNILNKQAVQEVTHNRLQTEIENLQEQAKKTGVTDELKQLFNDKVTQLKQVESEGLQTINEYVNNRTNIGNVTDNLDIFKRNYSLWGNLTGNIAVASTDLISGAFGALDYGAKTISKATGLKSGGLFEDASKDTKMLSEKIASEIEKPISVENINSLSDFGDWLMNDVGAKQIPILALISTGTAGVAGIGATALGSKFEDMRGEVQRGEKKYSTTEMLLHPLGYGLAETASAAVDLMVLKNAGRVISSATNLEKREIAKGMWSRAKNYLGTSIEGGISETLDETGTQGIENVIDGKPFTEGMTDAGAAGGAMGFIIPFIAANYKQTIRPFTIDNKIQEASAKSLKLQAQLDNPKLDSDTKLIIQDGLNKVKTEVESLIKKSVKNISILSNNQFKEIISIEKKQAEIKAKAEKIKFDDNLEDDLKNEIISNLKTEFDDTEQRRIDLLQRGASAEIGRLAPEEQIRLKDLAQRKLVKELNPDGTKKITLNDEQISKEAFAIYKEENVVNEKNNPNFVSDEQQTKISNSGTPKELGSGNEIYSREQEALNRLGERTRENEEKLQRPLTRFEIEDLQKEEALKFAKEKDLWVKDFYSLGTPTNIGGNENTIVYNQEEQTLYKSNNLSNHQNTLSSFFEGLEGHNAIFPETQYELVGFTGIDKGEGKIPYIEPILKQDFVLNVEQATQEDIDNHMVSIGFEKVNDHTFKNEQYTVSDLRPRNVLKDADGTIYVIDDIVKKNKPDEAAQSQNTPTDGNVQPGTTIMDESGDSKQKNTKESNVQSSIESRSVQTKTITSSKVKNPKTGESTTFDVDIENGIVIGIRNSKTGKPIVEFVEATYKSKDKKTGKIVTKTKLRKNGNWASIESEALGLETENELTKRNKEILTNFTPSNEYEAALHALATGSKVSVDSLASEAGNTDSKWATNQSAKETLPSVEKLSEQIWQGSEIELDQQEIRNQLIDIINSFGSVKEVQQAIINIGSENTIKLQEEEARAFLGSLTDKEFAQYEAIKAEEDYLSELTDEEADNYYNQKRNEYEQGEQATSSRETNERGETFVDINEEKQGEAGATKESEQRRQERVVDKKALDETIDWLTKLDQDLKSFGDETLGMNLPIVVARGAVKAMKIAAQTARTAQEIIEAGLDYVKQSDWYKNLSNKEQQDLDTNFKDYINKPFQGEEAKKSRFKIEEDIQARLNKGESEIDVLNSISDRREKMIAQDYIERQKNRSVPEVRKKIADSFQKADKALEDKKTTAEKIDKGFRNFISNFFDRQFVPKFILNKSGGRLVRNYLIASKGATGYAKQMYDSAHAKIYKGLTSAEIKTLDKIIQLRRFIAIDTNRAKNNMPDVVHPDFINKQDAEIELTELEKELGLDKFKDLTKRADNYFGEFKGLLSEMEKSGLISKESLDMFFEIDYQPRMFLEFLTKNETDFVPETSSNASLSADQIKKLEEGLNSSLIYDSQYLLSRSMNIRAKSIAMNNTNKKLVEFMEKQAEVVKKLKEKNDQTKQEKNTIKYFEELSKRVKINPIIGFTDTGNPKYKYDLPKGFKNANYYINGVKHSIMVEEVFHEQYFDSTKGFLNGNAKEIVAMASGTAVVKALATGNNPTFFITNTPRDLLFIATFSEEYGMSVPVNIAKVIKDAYFGIRDISKVSDNFKNFISYGGMMDFLTDQGKLKHTGVQKLLDKIDNKKREGISSVLNAITLNKVQMYSEIGFRMAVFNRSVKNQLKELGFDKIEDVADKSQVDDIYTNAVASARGLMDFNQGGKITKDADAFVPYLNAATQGTRVMFDNFRERPFETTFRVAQTAGVLSGATIGISISMFAAFNDDDEMTPTEKYLYAKKGVSRYDQTNYFIIFTGKKTEKGEFEYIRIAKPQQITPFFSMTDGIITSFIKKKIGDESSTDAIDNVMFALEKNISPVDFSITGNLARNPLLKSALTYSTGYDFYREQDLSALRGKVPVAAEGFESKQVEDFYKKIGEETGMSPARFKAGLESYITTPSTSPYVGFLYGGLDAMASDKEGKEVIGKLGKDLLKSTLNRVKKETTDFNRRLESNKDLKKKIEQAEIENLKTKSLFKKYAEAYTNKEMTISQISKELEDVAKESPFEAKRLKKMIRDKINNEGVSSYVFEIKYAKTAETKALMLVDLFGSDLKDISKLSPEEKKLVFQMKRMKAINRETLFEYNKLVSE
jgi:hypothetical protein